jgi:hypothetical protein
VIAGGPAPLIATWLFGSYQSPYAIAVYIGLRGDQPDRDGMMTDYTGKDIDGEQAHR